MRQPSNKALAVLGVLREGGEFTVNATAQAIRERTPCFACNGTGEGDHHYYGCARCYGRGHVSFWYSDAYQALTQLERHGLVTRRRSVDEWGDPTPGWVWRAADSASTDDPLEALYHAPSAQEGG